MLKKLAIFLYLAHGGMVRACWSAMARCRLRTRGARIGRSLSVRGWLNLHISPNATVEIGNRVRIKSGFGDNPVGGALRTGIWVNRGGRLSVGHGVGISNTTLVCSSAITIGDGTFIGGGTNIYDTDFHSLDPQVRVHGRDDQVKTAPVYIGRECFIGGHCIVLKGVTIGDQSIVAAGSVVTSDIPSGEIWGGNPARVIRKATTS
jgi:acetyltransferase-like isoleucine patch superfamily enzyme